MNNLIQVERGCMICSINIWLRAVAVHFSTPLRLYQPYACATDTDGEGQKNGQKLTHQSGEEPRFDRKPDLESWFVTINPITKLG